MYSSTETVSDQLNLDNTHCWTLNVTIDVLNLL
jgi:hypothetical protein